MIEILITEEQRKRANELYDFKILKGSVTKGEGNKVGALGEIIVWDKYKNITTYEGNYDYDLIIKNTKVDVKSKLQTVPPQPNHTCNIFAYNTRQKTDYYCFVVILSDLSKGWIVGWKDKESFFKEATFKKKGESDDNAPNSSFRFRDDCYCMRLDKLITKK